MQELIRKYHSGAYVFRENEDGDYAFIVRTGKIRLCCQRGYDLNTLEDLHEGRLFGEQAFAERTPRPSAAVAIAESECYAINRREFLAKLQQLDGERMRALRNLLLFVVRVPMFDARGVRVKPELATDILKQIAALCVSDLALSLTRTKEPLINLVAEQLRFEVERRLPRELRAAPPPPPPSPLRDKLIAKNAAPAQRVAAAPARTSVAPATPVSAAKPPAAKGTATYPSFDMRKV
ncbi:MAG: cyclic nucleotide-binding domain-containing protein [Telmatospirillum sp.]|nr:cyclic nucleotide-binding domain-containing protein [Telmatospirillum sp.]